MTKRFDFADSSLELDLCGELFMLDISERTAAVCEGIKRDAREKLSALKSGNGKDVGTDELCRFLADSIDRILGSVFGSRRMTMLDLTDLICFILSEIRGVLAERARRYRLAEHTDGAETESSAKGAEPAADGETADTEHGAESAADMKIADTAEDRESADMEHVCKTADTADTAAAEQANLTNTAADAVQAVK